MSSDAISSNLSSILSYAKSIARDGLTSPRPDPPERLLALELRDALFHGPKKPVSGKRRKKSEDAALVVDRPCSPSLFPNEAPPAKRLELDERLESTLRNVVTPLYDREHDLALNEDKLLQPLRLTALGNLLLPIRRPSIMDLWTPHEMAVFESALCLHGKKFEVIKQLLPGKTTKQVVEFYYVWKSSSHKQVWKKTFKTVE